MPEITLYDKMLARGTDRTVVCFGNLFGKLSMRVMLAAFILRYAVKRHECSLDDCLSVKLASTEEAGFYGKDSVIRVKWASLCLPYVSKIRSNCLLFSTCFKWGEIEALLSADWNWPIWRLFYVCHCIQSVPAMMLITKKSEVKLSESRTDTITRTHVIGAKCWR